MGKDPKKIQKNRQQKQARQAKRKRQVVRNELSLKTGQSRQVLVPAMGHVEAPLGFRAMGFGQALSIIGDAIRIRLFGADEPFDSMEQAQQVFNVAQMVWNYTQSDVSNAELRAMGVKALMIFCKSKNAEEVGSLFDEFCQFSVEMIPPDIQPRSTSYVFVRNTDTERIEQFHERTWGLSDDPVGAEDADRDLLKQILLVDGFLERGAEPDEDMLSDLENRLSERFFLWLERKGMKQRDNACETILWLYSAFVYRYQHQDTCLLGNIDLIDLDEFLFDFIVRKVNLRGYEYAKAPAVLRLIIHFLGDIGYKVDKQDMFENISELEEPYLDVLRERFQATVV